MVQPFTDGTAMWIVLCGGWKELDNYTILMPIKWQSQVFSFGINISSSIYIIINIFADWKVYCEELCSVYMYVHICHSVHLEPPFPSLRWGPIRAFAWAFCSEQLPMLRWPGTCTDLPTTTRYDVIRVLSGDVLMMWGFWMMTFTSQLHQGWGV